ncbi:MAG: hypothetical protein ACRCUM_02460 [Mycoplasmoidaceae bacterium]
MGRREERQRIKERNKRINQKLSKEQFEQFKNNVFMEAVNRELEKQLDFINLKVFNFFYESMRENKVSEDRAAKILETVKLKLSELDGKNV